MEDGLLSFLAGRGTAVLASSSQDESSWMGNGHACSLFTEAVCHAMKSAAGIRQGRETLFEIMEQTRAMMDAWNRTHPGHVQHPVFRADMIGDVRRYICLAESFLPDDPKNECGTPGPGGIRPEVEGASQRSRAGGGVTCDNWTSARHC